MKLFLIEDELDAVKGIKDYYEAKGWEIITSDFPDALEKIKTENPEIIVMDWMADIGDDEDRGRPIFKEIINRPIIVFSAAAASLDLEEIFNNPFIQKIPKGNEADVISKINEWEKYLSVVSDVRNQFNDAISFMMASLKPIIKLDSYPGDDVIKFMLNKQASEYFNSQLVDDEKNPTWTQYLYPPSSKNLLVADILKKTQEEKYYIVLTPSCDMARKKESDIDILVAECEDPGTFHNYVKPKDSDTQEKKDKHKEHIKDVSRMLSYGYNKGKVSLPELPNVFPYLTINLKKLSFIKLSEISLVVEPDKVPSTKYRRIVSVNSPYREQIVWAHMVNSCRPGVPDRDYKSWAEAII